MTTTRFRTLRSSSVLVARTTDDDGNTVWPVTRGELETSAQTDLADATIDTTLLDEDNDSGLIPEATEFIEDRAGVALITQTRRLYIDEKFPDDDIELGPFPVASIETVKYYDTDYTSTTVAATVYRALLGGSRQRLALRHDQSWPTDLSGDGECIWIDFTCGYGATPSAIPARWKRVIKVLATYLYEHPMPGLNPVGAGRLDMSFREALDKEIAMAGGSVRYD